MLGKEKLDRINELAAKKKSIGLSEAEQVEQQELRTEYLQAFRKNFKQQLDNVEIVYKD